MTDSLPSVSVLPLAAPEDWEQLAETILGSTAESPGRQILRRLEKGGVVCAVVESDYIDRDFLEEYAGFYASVFTQYGRHTRRIHFFTGAIASNTTILSLPGVVEKLAKEEKYRGFMVTRPVKDSPVGRTIVNGMCQKTKLQSVLEVRSVFETHLLGARLAVNSVPFVQQDNRMSACAQAALWICARHFNSRHGGPWKSAIAINADASTPVDEVIAQSLPAGAGGLGTKNIVRGFRALDKQPFAYAATHFHDKTKPPEWPQTLRPESVLVRYVRSRIPVIVALRSWTEKNTDGHAVVAVGCTFDPDVVLPKPKTGEKPLRHDWSVFSTHFLVQDDQRGVCMRVAVEPNSALSETPYNLRQHCVSLILPLPQAVFLTGERAERLAWDQLERYANDWPSLAAEYGTKIPKAIPLAQRAVQAMDKGEVVARTYLTFGWKYKAWVRNDAPSNALKQLVLDTGLPRMVWVTEFGMFQDLNKKEQEKRRIFGHTVVDATSSGALRPPLIVHAPGLLWIRSPAPPDFWAQSPERIFGIADDDLYRPRQRKP